MSKSIMIIGAGPGIGQAVATKFGKRGWTIAELRGSVPISGLQFEHSLVVRSSEQELISAGKSLGLGMVAWSPLGGVMLTSKYRQQGATGRREGFGGNVFQPENSDQRTAILDTLIAVANELGVTPGEAAIAWVAAKGTLPIIGPRTVEQLNANLAAANATLSAEQIARLDQVSAIPTAFPYNVLEGTRAGYTGGKVEEFDAPKVSAA
jgi:aryl-alcohol dehydrogenase-like predicted oxidoreductase